MPSSNLHAARRWKWSHRSLARLAEIHPDLRKVIQRALTISPHDLIILEGVRTEARQRNLVATGASRTMRSRHLTGHAVDVAPYVNGQPSWHWPHYHAIAPVIKQAAQDVGVKVEWGGDWRSFKDGPHWQLPWKQYPA